jgi:hypothetical protein
MRVSDMPCDIFLSYANQKDLFGAVSDFRDHFEFHVQRKTGKPLTVFQDKRNIHGGEEWARILSDELDSAKLLLILLSPGWLNSEWCRKEYTLFCNSNNSSRTRPIFPLMWDKVLDDHVEKGSEADAIFSELKKYQIRDWTGFSDDNWGSPDINKSAGTLATEIHRLLFGTGRVGANAGSAS